MKHLIVIETTGMNHICPSETPEGHSIGVVKNLSMSCEITQFVNTDVLLALISERIQGFNEFGGNHLQSNLDYPYRLFD